MKYIKLRDTLHYILTRYDIYSKADKYRDIYNTFLNYGSILESDTMLSIYNSKLFPEAEHLLKLERNYGWIKLYGKCETLIGCKNKRV